MGVNRITKINKGRLLQIGLKGYKYETRNGVIVCITIYLCLIAICYGLAIVALLGKANVGGKEGTEIQAFLLTFFVGTILVSMIMFGNGASIDGVYENGLTHRRVGLVKRYQGKHWIPWHEVKVVEYGLYDKEPGYGYPGGISEYLRVYAEGKDSWYFHRKLYDEHNSEFYPLLYKMLAERSPQARWVRKDVT